MSIHAEPTPLPRALGGPVWKVPADQLIAAVRQCAAQDPRSAAPSVQLALGSGRNDADEIAPRLVQAAIEGLGANPRNEWIAAIVTAAVKTAPTEVLEIVPAAIKAAPPASAPVIVAAAARAVPDPQKMVSLDGERRDQPPAIASGKDSDGKQLGENATEPQMTLAEAIVQVAMQADPGLSTETLTAAVDAALTPGVSVTVNTPGLTEVLPPASPIVPILPGGSNPLIQPGGVDGPGTVSP